MRSNRNAGVYWPRVVTTKRAIGFESNSGRTFEYRFGPREGVLASRAGENVVVVVTSRNAVAMAPNGGFAEFRLQLKEKLRDVRVRSNVATVRTDRRILIFRGPARSCQAQLAPPRIGLRDRPRDPALAFEPGKYPAKIALVDIQSTADESFGFRQPVGGLQQLCEVVEGTCYPRVIRSEAGLVDGEGSAIACSRLIQSVSGRQ